MKHPPYDTEMRRAVCKKGGGLPSAPKEHLIIHLFVLSFDKYLLDTCLQGKETDTFLDLMSMWLD